MESKGKVSFGFCIFLTLALLILPPRWSFAALLAALIHESVHMLSVVICGGNIISFCISGMGAKLEASSMGSGERALCALAGPTGSFLCLLASECYPELAICGLIQGAYNLLPIYPLDGSSFLRCICPGPVCKGAEWFALIIMTGLALWLAVYDPGLSVPVLISAWYPVIQRKISCKEGNLAVQ